MEKKNFQNETTDLLDNVPKAQQTLHHLKLTISVCEALIAFKFGSWSKDSDHTAQNINSLFKTYIRFIDFLKPVSFFFTSLNSYLFFVLLKINNCFFIQKSNKSKKGDPKKVDKDVTDRSMIRKNTRAVTLKLPNTVMDIQTVHKMLSLLFE